MQDANIGKNRLEVPDSQTVNHFAQRWVGQPLYFSEFSYAHPLCLSLSY